MHTPAATYLVTGGAGFIGSHVVKALLARGDAVLAVDNFHDYYDPALKWANLAPILDHPNFILYRQDITEPTGLAEIFDRHADALRTGGVIHLAARAGVRPSLTQPRAYLETNVTGTLNLVELAARHRLPRFVFASSSSVYGDAPESVPFVETQDISRPISPYAATKAMGESLLHSYSHLYGLRVVCLRFFTVYGPAQRPDLAIHKFSRLIASGQPIPVFGDGSTRRDYTYIEDTLQGILAALDYGGPLFDVFNLGEAHTTALIDLIRLLEAALGQEARLDWQPLQPGDVPITYASIDKAQRLLGYRPTTPIEVGIPRFVDWFQSMARERSVSSV